MKKTDFSKVHLLELLKRRGFDFSTWVKSMGISKKSEMIEWCQQLGVVPPEDHVWDVYIKSLAKIEEIKVEVKINVDEVDDKKNVKSNIDGKSQRTKKSTTSEQVSLTKNIQRSANVEEQQETFFTEKKQQ